MGKFYELFNMDAAVGVKELGLIYMKVNHNYYKPTIFFIWGRILQKFKPCHLEKFTSWTSGPNSLLVLVVFEEKGWIANIGRFERYMYYQ